MCGIVGYFGRSQPLDAKRLNDAVKALDHRGPDARGTWTNRERDVCLGHARLSIIDLDGGNQPLSNERGTVHAVVNGELYGYKTIQHQLRSRGHQLKTKSDSEILVHLYEEYGTDCTAYLRGEFAFVLWDEQQKTIYAGRDRFGIKPLYYANIDGRLYIASEIKALFAAGVPARWDHESLYTIWHRVLNSHRTLFKDVYQIPPGCLLQASVGCQRINRYWDWNSHQDRDEVDEPSQSRFDEVVHETRHLLDEAIALRMTADVPVAVYLSGGLDSSVVLGFARKHAHQKLDAFTVSFPNSSVDESDIAVRTAKHFNVSHHIMPVTAESLRENFERAVFHSETLHFNSHGAAKFLLSRLVRDHGTKVVLTGEGADEVFLSYDHLIRDLFRMRSDDVANDEYFGPDNNAGWDKYCETTAAIGLTQSMQSRLGGVPSVFMSFAAIGTLCRRLLSKSFLEQFKGYDPYADLLNNTSYKQLESRSLPRAAGYLFSMTNFPNYVLNLLGDRMEMANSVEGRTPFLDHKLVEFLNKQPATMFTRGLVEKALLRDAAKEVVTDEIYNRRKFAFFGPKEMKQDVITRHLCDLILGSSLDNVPVLDKQSLQEFTERVWRQGTFGFDSFVLYELASLCILQQRFSPSF